MAHSTALTRLLHLVHEFKDLCDAVVQYLFYIIQDKKSKLLSFENDQHFVVFCIAKSVVHYSNVSFSRLPRLEKREMVFVLSITPILVVSD